MEIERKFLINRFPNTLTHKTKKCILQGYLAVVKNGLEIRIRKYGRSYFQTVKTSGTLMRTEIEIKLSKYQFDKLWPLTEGQRIEKYRYTFDYQSHIIELDVYFGRLKGLIIAEIEFNSLAESKTFIAPNWFGKEVTKDLKFKNRNLAGK